MDEEIKRLLFTEEPYFDESFIGYIMRLADMNEIPDIRWILKSVRRGKFYKYDYRMSFDYRIHVPRLSKLTGVKTKKLNDLLYLEIKSGINVYRPFTFFDKPIDQHFITRANPRICSRCIAEQNYCRKIWEFSLATTCPIHKCFLLDRCPNCLRNLDWARPKINLCYCKFDFRNHKIFHLKEIELRLSKYFYQYFGLYTGQPEFVFTQPLDALSLEELLKLLLFVAAYFNSTYPLDRLGKHFFKYLSNDSMHHHLISAIYVFEGWQENYYPFVKDWHLSRWQTFFESRKPLECDDRFHIKTYDYELLNYILYEYFPEKQFAFLRRGFESFIEKFTAGEILDEPSFLDKLD